ATLGDVPEPIQQDQLLDFTARVSVIASPRVQSATDRVFELYHSFMVNLAGLPPKTPDPTEANRILEPIVQQYREAIEALRVAASSEVRSEPPPSLSLEQG